MRIRIKYYKNPVISSSEMIYATKWMSRIILSKQLRKHINITISYKDVPVMGLTNCLDDDVRKLRNFEIVINPGYSRKSQLLTLAHELVHVKQFAKQELHYNLVTWKKQHIPEDISDFDKPWEVEATGREYGLYRRYVDHIQTENIIFK